MIRDRPVQTKRSANDTPTLARLKACGIHEQVVEVIGRRILAGQFRPGSALPGDDALCRALGISRTALREGLRVLAAKGFIVPRRKIGTIVRPTAEWQILDTDVLSWLLDSGDSERTVLEVYELRHLIEPVAASLAARRGLPEHIEEMRQAYAEMAAAGDDGERIVAPDLRFHRAIIAASGNRLFSALGSVIAGALETTFRMVRNVPRGHRRSMPAHKAVMDAISRRDPARARLAMQKLIEDAYQDARTVRAAHHYPSTESSRAAKRRNRV